MCVSILGLQEAVGKYADWCSRAKRLYVSILGLQEAVGKSPADITIEGSEAQVSILGLQEAVGKYAVESPSGQTYIYWFQSLVCRKRWVNRSRGSRSLCIIT